jgi:hypothetical protein
MNIEFFFKDYQYTIQVAGVIVSFLAVLVSLYFGCKSTRTKLKLNISLEQKMLRWETGEEFKRAPRISITMQNLSHHKLFILPKILWQIDLFFYRKILPFSSDIPEAIEINSNELKKIYCFKFNEEITDFIKNKPVFLLYFLSVTIYTSNGYKFSQRINYNLISSIRDKNL